MAVDSTVPVAVGLAVGGVVLLVFIVAGLALMALRMRAINPGRHDGLYTEGAGRDVLARQPVYDEKPAPIGSQKIFVVSLALSENGG